MFLPDRFVKGECPKCHAQDQYGDNCEVCGTTYSPTELFNPYSAVSGAKPELRESEHFFFKLGECADFLKAWTSGNNPHDGKPHLQPEALNKMKEWLGEGEETTLSDWDISATRRISVLKSPTRRANTSTFGWTRPSAIWRRLKPVRPHRHRFRRILQSRQPNRDVPLHRQRHPLFPRPVLVSMLHFSYHRAPTGVYAHGFLTVDGQNVQIARRPSSPPNPIWNKA